MSALAKVALARGARVTGSDRDPGVEAAAALRAAGATVHAGHAAAYVAGARAVVVSAAVPPDHVEVSAARAAGIPILARKEALAGLVAEGATIGIAGTHGKTTTTVMTTEALAAAGFRPTGLAGGFVRRWGGNAEIGDSRWFVVEADEYDQAFLALSPTVAVITNVELDHLECYGSAEALDEAFVTFAVRAPHRLIGTTGDRTERVAARVPQAVRFGPAQSQGSICWSDLRIGAERTQARIVFPDGQMVELTLRVPGEHNLRNAVAALGVVHALEGDIEAGARALAAFEGVGRRFDVLGEEGGVTIVDDYAHHPTEIAATLAAARQRYSGRRVLAVFQPHLYSRTALHGRAMGEALAAADRIVVTAIYAAREEPIPGVEGHQVAEAATEAARGRGDAAPPVQYHADRNTLGEAVALDLAAGDVVLLLGAGDITRLGPELLARLRSAEVT